jgi:hypothetical protein
MTQAAAGSGTALWTAVAVSIGVSLAASEGRSRGEAAHPRNMHGGESETLVVPRAATGLVLAPSDKDDGWRDTGVTTGYLRRSDGHLAVPLSEARLVYTREYLYIALIAADDDIRTTGTARGDYFRLVFDDGRHPVVLEVTPDGALAGSGARAAAQLLGTANDPRDRDREWAVEIMIPLTDLHLRGEPGERVGFSVTRCNAPELACEGFGDMSDDGPTGRLVLGGGERPGAD